ncbi:ankyrin repeat domain-containing protein [Formosa haliotis]|uniref:ankyrin repeat domain-containing protein n=1 Tax=Formosa haliotis TaxID=1555194 RepID=UPI000824DDEA|nr:ankyrin repeat domain-containing protein [Formosa haliotis]
MKRIKTSICLLAGLIIMACGQNKSETQTTTETTIESPVKPADNAKNFDIAALLEAAQNGNLEAISYALGQGFDPNTSGEENRTTLMLAAFNGHTSVVKALLDSGATVDLRDTTDRTALMYGCTGPFASTVKLLVESGAQVNLKDNHEQWTPIMFAAGEGQIEVMKILLDAGADVNAVDVDGESSYDFAMSNKHMEAAAFLKPLMKS